MSAPETTPKAAYFVDNIRYDLPADQDDPRVDGLLWVARDLAEGLVECYERGVRDNTGKGGDA
jgi:hypothetical protein